MIFSIILCVSCLFLFSFFNIYHKSKIKYENLLAVLFSCDRSEYLNKTILSFFSHMKKYEPNIRTNFYFVDSGTPDRLQYVKDYRILNTFFMNPNNPEYAYDMFYSYLHGNFVLFLEDDRPFVANIEKKIFYPNFIEESILILQKTDEVKGMILKIDQESVCENKTIITKLGVHELGILKNPPYGYYYCNGPAVYNIKYLKQIPDFISENNMASTFSRLKWYIGFTYKGLDCDISIRMTTKCQGVSEHIGIKNSTQSSYTICINSMY